MVKSITKEEIAELPIARFEGRIVLIESELDCKKAVEYLSKQQAIGFDTETRPAFKKGHPHKIALMQLSSKDTCFLFRLNKIGIPNCLSELLSNAETKKIGLSLKDDFSAIRKRESLEPHNFIELQTYVKEFSIEDIGLQRIYAILFGQRIPKNQRLTNWEAETLTEAQQMYAAMDAWACLHIWEELNRLAQEDKNI